MTELEQKNLIEQSIQFGVINAFNSFVHFCKEYAILALTSKSGQESLSSRDNFITDFIMDMCFNLKKTLTFYVKDVTEKHGLELCEIDFAPFDRVSNAFAGLFQSDFSRDNIGLAYQETMQGRVYKPEIDLEHIDRHFQNAKIDQLNLEAQLADAISDWFGDNSELRDGQKYGRLGTFLLLTQNWPVKDSEYKALRISCISNTIFGLKCDLERIYRGCIEETCKFIFDLDFETHILRIQKS